FSIFCFLSSISSSLSITPITTFRLDSLRPPPSPRGTSHGPGEFADGADAILGDHDRIAPLARFVDGVRWRIEEQYAIVAKPELRSATASGACADQIALHQVSARGIEEIDANRALLAAHLISRDDVTRARHRAANCVV